MNKIAIIGLGLIGGSIGLALQQHKSQGFELFGYDDDVEVGRRAAKRGAVDKAAWHLRDAIEGADLIIVAVPVLGIREVLENITEMVQPGCVVTDTGSTKEAVMNWAEDYLPKGVSFVGGHPMAGKELSGIENADASLFQGARYVVIPGKGARKEAAQTVIDLAKLLGARPYFLDASEHDSFVAAVSHLPILLSTALVSATNRSSSWREISKLAATGFRDVSRLASGDPVMNLDICVSNRESLVHWLDEAIKELHEYRNLIEATGTQEAVERLGESFAKAWEARETWLLKYESGQDDYEGPDMNDLPSMGESMADVLVGTRLRERYQQINALQQRKAEERRTRRLRRP